MTENSYVTLEINDTKKYVLYNDVIHNERSVLFKNGLDILSFEMPIEWSRMSM